MTRYEERLRSLQLSPAELADMAQAETEELVRGGPAGAKDHAIKLQILRKLRDEATTPELAPGL